MSEDNGNRRGSLSWRSLGVKLFTRAMEDNLREIKRFVATSSVEASPCRILDLGCGDGKNFRYYAPPGALLYGVDGNTEALEAARRSGIDTRVADLDGQIPFESGTFSYVTSNQVFEHLADTDRFVAECFRLLQPGGVVVISTENLGSWHNILALSLGWQAFSLTNVSMKAPAIGNPAGLLRDQDPPDTYANQHRRVFSYRGMVELLQAHGFVDVTVRGAGYYPFPSRMAKFDPRHAAFLIAYGVRPIR